MDIKQIKLPKIETPYDIAALKYIDKEGNLTEIYKIIEYVDNLFIALVDNAPEELNTLKELADELKNLAERIDNAGEGDIEAIITEIAMLRARVESIESSLPNFAAKGEVQTVETEITNLNTSFEEYKTQTKTDLEKVQSSLEEQKNLIENDYKAADIILEEKITENKQNIDILNQKIIENSTSSYDNFISTSDASIELGKTTGQTKLIVDSESNKVEINTPSNSFSFSDNGLAINQVTVVQQNIGGYGFIHNTQNNHLTLKWVGEN